MARYNYDRLTALDNSFLVLEGPNHLMHVGMTALFEAGPLATKAGGVDIDRIMAYVESRLPLIPRYRQRLAYIPIEQHPVWIDDARFNLHYHVRHARLPAPGDERRLKRMVARIKAQELDRGKPLWEMWIIEGVEGNRFAMVSKVHHCMVDGVSGVDLVTVLLTPKPDTAFTPPRPWIPRPAPSSLALLRDEAAARLGAPLQLASRLLREPGRLFEEARDGVSALSETLRATMRQASETPFNQPVGPHRRFDWAITDIGSIKQIREQVGGTLNDVVLTTVSGAVRRFLERRGVKVRDITFRVFVPVSLRTADERGTLGNRVATWAVDLPIAERDPRRRLARVSETTARLKESKMARGSEILTEMAEWTGSGVLRLGTTLASQSLPFNMVVTNVPGPPQPLYMLGARLQHLYPYVPIFVNQGLGIALFSYAGLLHWGFNADWDTLPDLHDFVADIDAAFAELYAAAVQEPATVRRQKTVHGIRANGGAPAEL